MCLCSQTRQYQLSLCIYQYNLITIFVFQVFYVVLQFYSPMPKVVTIERRKDIQSPWQPWQYYAEDCQMAFNKLNNGPLTTATDVNCLQFGTYVTSLWNLWILMILAFYTIIFFSSVCSLSFWSHAHKEVHPLWHTHTQLYTQIYTAKTDIIFTVYQHFVLHLYSFRS